MVSTLERPLFRNNSSPAVVEDSKYTNHRCFGLFKPRNVYHRSNSVYETDTMSLRRQWAKRSPYPQRSHSIQKEEPRFRNSSWQAFVRAFLCLSLHFLILLVVLSSAAVVFTHFEEKDVSMRSIDTAANTSQGLTGQKEDKVHEQHNQEDFLLMYRAFWSSMESKYNMTFSGDDRESLKPLKRDSLRDVDDDIISLKEKNPTYNYKKWFYFATIASSTIGG